MGTITCVMLGAGLIIGELCREQLVRNRIRTTLSDRELLSFEQIYLTYYEKRKMDRQVVQTVWKELSYALGTEMGRLRPDDRLGCCRGAEYTEITTEHVEEIMTHYLPFEVAKTERFETIDSLIVAICQDWERNGWLLRRALPETSEQH